MLTPVQLACYLVKNTLLVNWFFFRRMSSSSSSSSSRSSSRSSSSSSSSSSSNMNMSIISSNISRSPESLMFSRLKVHFK